jgi:hypothetical protein
LRASDLRFRLAHRRLSGIQLDIKAVPTQRLHRHLDSPNTAYDAVRARSKRSSPASSQYFWPTRVCSSGQVNKTFCKKKIKTSSYSILDFQALFLELQAQ